MAYNPSYKNAAAPENLPVLLMALALVIWFSFQLAQNLKVRENLVGTYEKQTAQLESANKVRQSLSTLALSTKQLASQGNANAAVVVKNLAARGININPPQAPGETPPANK
ncbi:MAG: hypothetical protein ACKN9T_17880 [Candidatus Methylumidiphilus sp.]